MRLGHLEASLASRNIDANAKNYLPRVAINPSALARKARVIRWKAAAPQTALSHNSATLASDLGVMRLHRAPLPQNRHRTRFPSMRNVPAATYRLPMTSATLLGYYGNANIGDDVFCEVFTAKLREAGYSHIFAPNAADALSQRLRLDNQTSTRRAIEQSHAVVVGGGGILGRGVLSPQPYADLEYYHKVSLFCRLRGRSLVLLGVGAGPLETRRAKRIVRRIVSNATLVHARDKVSFQCLQNIKGINQRKILLAGDPATALDYSGLTDTSRPIIIPKSRPCIGINLFPFTGFASGPPMDSIHEDIIAWVDKALATNLIRSVIWFSTNPGRSEMLLNYRAYERFNGSSSLVVYNGNPWSWVKTLGVCDSFLSMKLHSGVFAAGMTVPLMGIGYHPKIERFYRALGLLDYYLPCDEVGTNSVQRFLDRAFPGARSVNTSDAWLQEAQRAVSALRGIPSL